MVLSLVYAHIGIHAHYSWDHALLHIALVLFWTSILLLAYAMAKKSVRKWVLSVVSRMLKSKT